ncbi:MAG: cytochrome b/b6 domain-containing protein [Candidatus Korobacteraceae bacterium]
MNRYARLLLIAALLAGATVVPGGSRLGLVEPANAQAAQPATRTHKRAAAAKPAKLSNAGCLACHSDPSLTKEEDGKQVSLQVNEEKFTSSIHGSMFTCVDCHKDVTSVPHESTPAKPSCVQCHAEQQKAYDSGLHAKAREAGVAQAATCVDCHGDAHEILPAGDPNSKVSHKNVAATCGACHGERQVMALAGMNAAPFHSYEDSIHGKLVAGGNEKAAVCNDCHGAHDIRPPSDPQSSIFRKNVPQTCAKCHQVEKAEFMASIHGQAVSKGNLHAPVCTDCHGTHLIKTATDPTSSVAAANLSKDTCAQCHDNVKMSQEFGVVGGRKTSYLNSYHGLATERGSKQAANCASCHGVHNILPSSDPRSTINKANLVHTCGKCHPGANANFAASRMHIDPHAADIESKVVRFVRDFYQLLIIATIGGMLLHNGLVLQRKLSDLRAGHTHVMGGPRVVVRMSFNQRAQHICLFISFLVLVLTGFALKYPNSWLGMMFLGESVRRTVHRTAGVVLILVGVYHVWYVSATREGRKLVIDFLPEWKDIADVKDALLYYLRLSGRKPQFKRFNYAEKMEYWALVWGTVVMGVTGVMMWAKVSVGNHVPRWFIDAATAVHFYEAILASLAILVWHFYMVIFDPEVYPMNWAWYDGKMSLQHYVEEHGADMDTISTAIEASAEASELHEVQDARNQQ